MDERVCVPWVLLAWSLPSGNPTPAVYLRPLRQVVRFDFLVRAMRTPDLSRAPGDLSNGMD
jgi:hypothetical protein